MKKNLLYIYLFSRKGLGVLVFSFFAFNNFVFAHDILQTLSADNMSILQHKLIEQGYLATTSVAKFGVYNSATEEAFNKWQDNRNKQYFTQNSLPDASSSDESNTNFTWFMDLLKEIVDFFRSFF